jgi:DNA-binding transcriptional regulator YiaG
MDGATFRDHRQKRLGISQSQLARALGVHTMTISKWEREVHDIPEPAARLIERMTKADVKRFAKRRV